MKKIFYDSQRCKDCGRILRWVRGAQVWRCTYCPAEWTEEQVKDTTLRELHTVDDIPLVQLFGSHPPQPVQAASAAIASTPSSTYNLRDEK